MNTIHRFASCQPRRRTRRAFALQELAVVLGAVALLAAIGIPSMTSIQQNAWDVVCLNNLRQIGRASQQYANDDRFDQAVPISLVTARREPTAQMTGDYGWTVAEAYAFGGQTPTDVWVVDEATVIHGMLSVADGGNGYWIAEHRPLNQYITSDPDPAPGALSVYRCPVDSGPLDWPDMVCFDVFGNSYTANLAGSVVLDVSTSRICSSPYGHRASSIASPPSETVIYSEPTFYRMTLGKQVTPLNAWGWHGRFRADNVLYLDGSAHLTRFDPMHEFTDEELAEINYPSNLPAYYYLRRGPGYRMDCYPTPGALILRASLDGAFANYLAGGAAGVWPYDNYQSNVNPE